MTRHWKLTLPVALLLSLAAMAQENDLRKKLESRVTEICQKAGYPGLTAAVALPDGPVLTAAAGWADADHRIPMKTSHRMYAGSVGKTFAAAVILQAVDEGKLDLDSAIDRWLGREPWFDRLPNARQLTLRLLLSHRAGLADYQEPARLS